MINKGLKEFLIEIANDKLRNNTFAWVIATYYNKINLSSNKEKFYESIVNFYKQFRERKDLPLIDSVDIGEENLSNITNKDFRIKSIRLANVRGIPDVGEDGLLYGFDLVKNDMVNNAVILGPNAVGKSSIFSSIEYIYANEIGETKLRTKDKIDRGDEKFDFYLERLNSGYKNAKCIIDTKAGIFSFNGKIFNENIRKMINPQNHFISDFDIYENGQLNYEGDPSDENSFHFLIARSLGFEEFLSFNGLVKNFVNYKRLKEKKQITSYENEKSKLGLDIKNWEIEISNRKMGIENLKKDNDFENKPDILERREKAKADLFKFNSEMTQYVSITDKIIIEFENYNKTFATFAASNIDDLINIETDFLTLGLELIKNRSYDNCPFCHASSKDIKAISDDAEKQLASLEAFNKLRKLLVENFTELIDSLNLFHRQFLNRKEYYKKYYSIISNYSDLFELSDLLLEYIKWSDSQLEKEPINIVRNYITAKNTINEMNSLFSITSNSNSDFLKYFQETDEYNIAFQENILKKIEELRQAINKEDSSAIYLQTKAILESEVKKFEQQIKSAEQRIQQINDEIKALDDTIFLFEELKGKAEEYSKVFDDLVNKSVIEALEPIEGAIKEILEDYFDKEENNVKIIIERKQIPSANEDETPTGKIVAKLEIIDMKTGELISLSPNKYYNTFRYKIFCLMVSCSIAIASRKKTGINLPLILDDIFYASDYLNKTTFINFLNRLIQLFKKHTPELPLQFILFTHDDMIFQSALDAIEMHNDKELTEQLKKEKFFITPESEIILKERTIFARLFKAEDKDDNPSVLHDDSKYWNMLYKLSEVKLNNILKLVE